MNSNIYSKSVYPQTSPIEAIAQKRLDNSSLLHIQEVLRGKTYIQDTDEKGNVTFSGFVKTAEPVMNEKGIGAVMLPLSMFINPIVWLSKLSAEQIDNMCFNIDMALEKMLINKEEEYEMNQAWSIIKDLLIEFIEASLRKAEDGFTSDELKSVKSIEMQKIDDGTGRQGFGKVLGLGG